MYLSASLSLSESLILVEEQSENRVVKKTIAHWREVIENGQTLESAFSLSDVESIGVLKMSAMSIQSAGIGERSASLSNSLKSASVQIEKNLETRKKVFGAMAYPLTILIGTSGLVLGLVLFVFPRVIPLFESLDVKLPFATRVLIFFHAVITQYWVYIVLTTIVLIMLTFGCLKYFIRLRRLVETLIVRLPVVGVVIRTKNVSLIFDSLHTLIKGGEQLSDSLIFVSKIIPFYEYQRVLEILADEVTNGRHISDYIRSEKKIFPAHVFGIMSAGERTGNLEQSLMDVANVTRGDLDDRLKILTSIIEPALMVMMSLIIGFVALSIILPIYGITSHFQGG
jgi:type II secretory pathway component PulF